MTVISYPAVGEDGYSADQWQAQFGSFEGIIDDVDNDALTGTVDDGANTVTISPGKVQVSGYVLEVSVAEVMAVSTSAATYWVVAKYDPALNVADGGGDADPLGPCRLLVVSGTPSTSGGKAYFTLYKFTRAASQLLSDAWAGRTSYRYHMGPQLHTFDRFTSTRGYLENAPIGTTVRESSTGNVWVRERLSGDTDPSWVNRSRPVRLAMDVPNYFVAQDAPPTFLVYPDGRIGGSGTLKRSSGASVNQGSDLKLAGFAFGYRPAGYRRFPLMARYGDGSTGTVYSYMNTDGDLWLYESSVPFVSGSSGAKKSVTWIDLGQISFFAEL